VVQRPAAAAALRGRDANLTLAEKPAPRRTGKIITAGQKVGILREQGLQQVLRVVRPLVHRNEIVATQHEDATTHATSLVRRRERRPQSRQPHWPRPGSVGPRNGRLRRCASAIASKRQQASALSPLLHDVLSVSLRGYFTYHRYLFTDRRLTCRMCRNDANQIHTRSITVFVCQVLAKAVGNEEALGLLKPYVESIELLCGPPDSQKLSPAIAWTMPPLIALTTAASMLLRVSTNPTAATKKASPMAAATSADWKLCRAWSRTVS
jgi:hypothetical protein